MPGAPQASKISRPAPPRPPPRRPAPPRPGDAFASVTGGYAYTHDTRYLGESDRSERLIEALEECR